MRWHITRVFLNLTRSLEFEFKPWINLYMRVGYSNLDKKKLKKLYIDPINEK